METVLVKTRETEKERLEPDNLECALTYSIDGLLNIYRRKFDLAIKEILDGKKIRKEKFGNSHKYVAASNYLIGNCISEKGDCDHALQPFNEALQVYNVQMMMTILILAITLIGIG